LGGVAEECASSLPPRGRVDGGHVPSTASGTASPSTNIRKDMDVYRHEALLNRASIWVSESGFPSDGGLRGGKARFFLVWLHFACPGSVHFGTHPANSLEGSSVGSPRRVRIDTAASRSWPTGPYEA
jgi:hypothetical protein